MSEPIYESEMLFGPYPAGLCFEIEKSPVYQALQNGIKIAEFALLNSTQTVLSLVEAKSSSPQPTHQGRFEQFINEIVDKFINSFHFLLSLRLGRHSGHTLPAVFKNMNLSALSFQFVLVIKPHQAAWLPPLQAKIQNELRKLNKTFKLSSNYVVVLNEEMAIRRRFLHFAYVNNLKYVSSTLLTQLNLIATPVSTSKRVSRHITETAILQICENRFVTLQALSELLQRDPHYLKSHFLDDLFNQQKLEYAFPSHPAHPHQAYRSILGGAT
jgi:hypothetical protein